MTVVYLDTEDFFFPIFSGVPYYYRNRNGTYQFSIEPYVKGSKPKPDMVTVRQLLAKTKPKAKRDWTGISSIILALSMIGAVTAYTVYTAIEVLFG